MPETKRSPDAREVTRRHSTQESGQLVVSPVDVCQRRPLGSFPFTSMPQTIRSPGCKGSHPPSLDARIRAVSCLPCGPLSTQTAASLSLSPFMEEGPRGGQDPRARTCVSTVSSATLKGARHSLIIAVCYTEGC